MCSNDPAPALHNPCLRQDVGLWQARPYEARATATSCGTRTFRAKALVNDCPGLLVAGLEGQKKLLQDPKP